MWSFSPRAMRNYAQNFSKKIRQLFFYLTTFFERSNWEESIIKKSSWDQISTSWKVYVRQEKNENYHHYKQHHNINNIQQINSEIGQDIPLRECLKISKKEKLTRVHFVETSPSTKKKWNSNFFTFFLLFNM